MTSAQPHLMHRPPHALSWANTISAPRVEKDSAVPSIPKIEAVDTSLLLPWFSNLNSITDLLRAISAHTDKSRKAFQIEGETFEVAASNYYKEARARNLLATTHRIAPDVHSLLEGNVAVHVCIGRSTKYFIHRPENSTYKFLQPDTEPIESRDSVSQERTNKVMALMPRNLIVKNIGVIAVDLPVSFIEFGDLRKAFYYIDASRHLIYLSTTFIDSISPKKPGDVSLLQQVLSEASRELWIRDWAICAKPIDASRRAIVAEVVLRTLYQHLRQERRKHQLENPNYERTVKRFTRDDLLYKTTTMLSELKELEKCAKNDFNFLQDRCDRGLLNKHTDRPIADQLAKTVAEIAYLKTLAGARFAKEAKSALLWQPEIMRFAQAADPSGLFFAPYQFARAKHFLRCGEIDRGVRAMEALFRGAFEPPDRHISECGFPVALTTESLQSTMMQQLGFCSPAMAAQAIGILRSRAPLAINGAIKATSDAITKIEKLSEQAQNRIAVRDKIRSLFAEQIVEGIGFSLESNDPSNYTLAFRTKRDQNDSQSEDVVFLRVVCQGDTIIKYLAKSPPKLKAVAAVNSIINSELQKIRKKHAATLIPKRMRLQAVPVLGENSD